MLRAWFVGICLVGLVDLCWAAENHTSVDKQGVEKAPEKTVCELIDEAAAKHGLPVAFFTRLIWKESRFRPTAVSPKGAQGIAQFMPGTASLRGLADPFDATEAIPASAKYLRELAGRFGSIALAAAAYNSGEKRVHDWLEGLGRLPGETQDYVLSVTGRTVEELPIPDPTALFAEDPSGSSTVGSCADVVAVLTTPGAGASLIRVPHAAAPRWAPWGVQVAGDFSAERAMGRYARLQREHSLLLGDRAPMVVRSTLKSRGTAPLHQIRVPAASREEAERLCKKLRDARGACIVMRNAQ